MHLIGSPVLLRIYIRFITFLCPQALNETSPAQRGEVSSDWTPWESFVFQDFKTLL